MFVNFFDQFLKSILLVDGELEVFDDWLSILAAIRDISYFTINIVLYGVPAQVRGFERDCGIVFELVIIALFRII